jgi:hypothetical protein
MHSGATVPPPIGSLHGCHNFRIHIRVRKSCQQQNNRNTFSDIEIDGSGIA